MVTHRYALRGFSTIELAIALGLTLTLAATLLTVLRPVHAMFVVEPDRADIEQRVRVGADALARDLMVAGAGASVFGHAGPLRANVPPVQPRRINGAGESSDSFRPDAITIVYVPDTAAQTTLVADVAPGAWSLPVTPLPGCAGGLRLCAFSTGTTALVYADDGAFDLLTVASIVEATTTLTTTSPAVAVHRMGAAVVAVEVRSYYLKNDTTTQSVQLVRSGVTGPDVPVVDHVVGLAFEYYGDGGVASPPGVLVRLDSAALTDGPWRPDSAAGNRWDADLSRVRTVVVTLRVEAASAALRGPAGLLFARGGTATDAKRWAPDHEIRFTVSPRNMSLP